MIARTFVDSNILIYAHDADAGSKQQRAAARLTELWQSGAGLLSTQVLQEFYAVWVESAITAAMIARASEIGEIWQISFWDAMVLAAAEQSRAEILLTEDLNAAQKIAGIEIVSPFSEA